MDYLQHPAPTSSPELVEQRFLRDIILRPITPRQLECLAWAAEGKTATEIGLILGISPRTVEKHLAHICEAFGVRTRVQAVMKAYKLGILPRVR